jgi:hypothetical protein
MIRRAALNKPFLVALLSSAAALALCAFQFGDRYNLNSVPFAQVRNFVSDLPKARALAKQGNIELFAGDAVPGQTVRLRGELTDSNCYLGRHHHAYDHAFCAKLCVAAGSPLVFLSDEGDQLFLVLTAQNATPIANDILDSIGVPGITVIGKTNTTNNIHALAVEALAQPSASNQH